MKPKLLRDALPRFHAEATHGIAMKPDDEIPEKVSRESLLAQLARLVFLTGNVESGSLRVSLPERRGAERGYAFSLDFDIPSGSVIADLDLDFSVIGFEPIGLEAIQDLKSQLQQVVGTPPPVCGGSDEGELH